MSAIKEVKEAAKAAGMVLGEVHEITKNGLGIEDLKSIKDLIENKRILVSGVEGLDEVSLKDFSYNELIGVVMALKEGFDLGAK